MEVGWGWCGKGESMEGLRMDWLSVPHHAHDGGLPLDNSDAEVLGLHLLALLIGYDKPAKMLLWPVGVPLWAGMVPVVVAAVIVHSWGCRSGGQGFPVMGSPWRLRWGLGRRDKGVSSGHSMQDDPKGIAHWVIGANSVWRGVLSKEGRDVEGKGLEGVRGRW